MDFISSIILNQFVLFTVVFFISLCLFFYARRMLSKHQFGQVIRKDGPETHLKKKGTPTMGGLVFIIVLLFIELLLLIFKDYIGGTLALKINIFIIIFGFIGLIDDYLKVTKKNTKGLPSIFKLILQILFAGFGLIICFRYNTMSNIFLFLFLIFIIVGADNGVNFTDGLDGLCTIITIIVSVFFVFVCIKKQNSELLYIVFPMIGILLAFLIFNHYPAKIFMGDTGSLLLGAYVSFISYALDIAYFLPIFGFIYMIEVLSVIIQVLYFKATKGKRFFKMAPIHHHFEKCNLSENKICLMFGIITFILCSITYYFI